MAQISAADAELTRQIGTYINVAVEAYPQLKATGNVGQLQEELTSTENRIAFARQHYNDVSTQYNTKQQQFPTNLVAGLAKAACTSTGRMAPVTSSTAEATGSNERIKWSRTVALALRSGGAPVP